MSAPLLGPDEIFFTLPYGRDFLFVSRVWALERGRSITTSMEYCRSDAIVAAHFRDGDPAVPGVILAEQVCQSALLLGLLSETLRPGFQMLLGRLDCRFEQPAVPDCTILSRIELLVSRHGAFGFVGDARIEDQPVATFKATSKAVPGRESSDFR